MKPVARRQSGQPRPVLRFADMDFEPMLSGALYWTEQKTMLVADLHLEKMASFARSRQFLPPYDTAATLGKLSRDILETGAERVVALGDSFHRDWSPTTLSARDRHLLTKMMTGLEWVWIAGNHDPSGYFPGGTFREHLVLEGINLSHVPDAAVRPQIAGHLHPAARVRIGNRSTRHACFIHDEQRLILPAYGVSTGTLNVLDAPFDQVLNRNRIKVAVIGRERIYPVSLQHLTGRRHSVPNG